MPGPCSAPNGNISIVNQKRDKAQMVKSGKTAYKRGQIDHATKVDTETRLRKERKRARDLEDADST